MRDPLSDPTPRARPEDMRHDGRPGLAPVPLRLHGGQPVEDFARLAEESATWCLSASRLARQRGLSLDTMGLAQAMASLPAFETRGYTLEGAAELASHAQVMWSWFMEGLPRIDTGHRHAALLATASMPASVVEDVVTHLPWAATGVLLPNDLVRAPLYRLDGRGAELASTAMVLLFRGGVTPEGVSLLLVPADSRRHELSLVTFVDPASCARFLGASREVRSNEDTANLILLWRFVLGAVAELTAYRPSVQPSASRPALPVRRKRDGRPVATVFTIARPVRVDCRPALEAFRRAQTSTGTGRAHPHAAPSVCVTVHAHWKMQPCGPRSSERQRIFVEEYDRGPEGAPRAVRAHLLVDSPRGAGSEST